MTVTKATTAGAPAFVRMYTCDRTTDAAWDAAIAWAAVQSGSPTAAGMIVLVSVIPQLLVMPIGGAVADRWGTEAVIRWTLLSRLVTLTVFAAIATSAGYPWLMLAVLGAVWATTDAIHLPALLAVPGRLTQPGDRDAQRSLQGKLQAIQNIAVIGGGGLSGVLIASDAPWTAPAGAALLTVLALVSLVQMSRKQPSEPHQDHVGSMWHMLKAGVIDTWSRPKFRLILLLTCLINFLSAPVAMLGLPFLADQEGWSWEYGVVFGAIAVGGVTGGLLLNRFGDRITRPVETAVWLLVPTGLSGALLVQTTNIAAEIVVAFICGIVIPPFFGSLYGELLSDTETHQHGRIMSLMKWSGLSLIPLGAVLFGVLVEHIGLTAAGWLLSVPLILLTPAILLRIRMNPRLVQ